MTFPTPGHRASVTCFLLYFTNFEDTKPAVMHQLSPAPEEETSFCKVFPPFGPATEHNSKEHPTAASHSKAASVTQSAGFL